MCGRKIRGIAGWEEENFSKLPRKMNETTRAGRLRPVREDLRKRRDDKSG